MQRCLRGLGHLAIDRGDVYVGRRLLRESLALAHASGDRLELAWSLEGLSGVAVDARPERAVRLAGAAAALREAIASRPYPWERERLDRWLGAAARNVGQDAYTAAWAQGRAMSLEQALAMAGADGADETLQDAGVPGHSTHDLSPREREVIRLVAGGRTNRQIAEHLVIARARLILTSATSSQSSICTRAPSWLCGLSSMA
jgi:hypothetical protein